MRGQQIYDSFRTRAEIMSRSWASVALKRQGFQTSKQRCIIGANLIIRIGFWCLLNNIMKRNPQNIIGPYIGGVREFLSLALGLTARVTA